MTVHAAQEGLGTAATQGTDITTAPKTKVREIGSLIKLLLTRRKERSSTALLQHWARPAIGGTALADIPRLVSQESTQGRTARK